MEKTYSLYTYQCGSLKIFGNRSSRAKYKSIAEAVEDFHKYNARLAKVTRYDVVKTDPQVLLVEYTDAYTSRIIGVLSSTNIDTFNLIG